jgi:amidohydrolase
MVKDGLMERFGIDEVYGMHNMPGLPVGTLRASGTGGIMASRRHRFEHRHRGPSAAMPPARTTASITVLAGAADRAAPCTQIVARNVDPLKSAVISITCFNAGFTDNVIPQTAKLLGTVRSLDPGVRDLLERRLREVAPAAAAAYGATARVDYRREYPVTVNHPRETAFAAEVAREVAGAAAVDADRPPEMGAEDFSFMLEKRPGAMIFVGNGDSALLHHPAYDFDDAAIPAGASFWVRLVERALPGA